MNNYNNPLISILMPAYNAAKFIADSIESVLVQTYTNWELLIVDDGSTDTTRDIMQQYEKKDARIHCFYQENGKQGKARNLALSKSGGELIAFLDSDDIWLPSKLRFSVDEFNRNTQDVLYMDTYVFHTKEDLADVTKLEVHNIPNAVYKGDEDLGLFLRENRVAILTALVTREAMLTVKGFRNRGGVEDYELWLNILAAGYTIRSVNAKHSVYRITANSSTSDDRMAVDRVIEMLHTFFEEHPSLIVKYRTQIALWMVRSIDKSKTKAAIFETINNSNMCKFGLRGQFIVHIQYLSPILSLRVLKAIIRKTITQLN